MIGTGLDIWSSKLIGCHRLLQIGLAKLENDLDASLGCILIQYNWAAMMGRVLMRGILPSSKLDEMKYISRCESALVGRSQKHPINSNIQNA